MVALLILLISQSPEFSGEHCYRMVERYQRATQIPILTYGQAKSGNRPVPFDTLVGFHGTSLASVDYHIQRGVDPDVPPMTTDFYFWPFYSERTNRMFKEIPRYPSHRYYMLNMKNALSAGAAYADKGADVAGYSGHSAGLHLVIGVDQKVLSGRTIEMGRAESLILVDKNTSFPYMGVNFTETGEGGLPIEGIHSLLVPTKEAGLLIRGFFQGRMDLWKSGGPKSAEEVARVGKTSPYAYESLLELFHKSPAKFMDLAKQDTEGMRRAFGNFTSDERRAFQTKHPETFEYFLELYGADLGPLN